MQQSKSQKQRDTLDEFDKHAERLSAIYSQKQRLTDA